MSTGGSPGFRGVHSFESPLIYACHLGVGSSHNSVVTSGGVPVLVTLIVSAKLIGVAELAGRHSVATLPSVSTVSPSTKESKDEDHEKRLETDKKGSGETCLSPRPL